MFELEKQNGRYRVAEVWKAIPETNGRYEASTRGQIRERCEGRKPEVTLLEPIRGMDGTTTIKAVRNFYHLYPEDHPEDIAFKGAELVLETFIGSQPPGHRAYHWHDDLDDSIENISWEIVKRGKLYRNPFSDTASSTDEPIIGMIIPSLRNRACDIMFMTMMRRSYATPAKERNKAARQARAV